MPNKHYQHGGRPLEWEIANACKGESGKVTVRPMTEEERQRYGVPPWVHCPDCGRHLPHTRRYFDLNGLALADTCKKCFRRRKGKVRHE